MVPQTLQWQRVAVLVAVIGGAVTIWATDGDAFDVPKATLIVLAAIAAAASGVGREIRVREIVIPWTPPLLAAAVFIVFYGLATIVSTTPMQSLVGQYRQNAGFALYAACVVIFLTVIRSHDVHTLPSFVRGIVVAAAIVVGYAVLQWADLDPVGWGDGGGLFSTLGNPNFLAGWVGIALPLCLGVALVRSHAVPWRVVAGATAVLILPVAYKTDSFQGPVTIAASGLAFLLLFGLGGSIRVPTLLRGRRGLLAIGALVLVLVPIGVVLVHEGLDQGLTERKYFWRAAVEVVQDHPVLGTGPDTFHNQFLSRRSAHQASVSGANAGAAHDVPLGILAESGLLGGLPYLAFVGLVGWRLVVAVRRRQAAPWLVASVGAAWIGYQVQSLVSIDKPALAIMHWALAGAVVVLSGPLEAHAIPLPGRRERPTADAPLSTIVSIASMAIVALVLSWFVTQPFRADLADIAGKQAIERGDGATAARELQRARDLAPWEASYTFDQVILYSRAGNAKLALRAAVDGARLEPGDSSYAVAAGKVADAVHEPAVAKEMYDLALEQDPYGLDVLLSAALSAATAHDAPRAHRLLDRSLDLVPGLARTVRVGDIYASLGDAEAARRSYEAVLEDSPDDKGAKRGLADLGK